MIITQSLCHVYHGLNRFRLSCLCRLLILIILMYKLCLVTLLEKINFSYQVSGDRDTVNFEYEQHHNCTYELIKQGYIVKRNTSTLHHRKLDSKTETEQDNREQIPQLKAEESKLLSCANLSVLKLGRNLGKGITKEVFQSSYKGTDVAVKMITPSVEDVTACLKRGKYNKPEECYLYANYKLLKEITLSLQLNHRNILKILGYCVRSEHMSSSLHDHGVVLISELGLKVSKMLVRKSNWAQKIQHCIDILDLMDYLEHSPVGSLGVYDFKVSQFVLVNGTIKLSDLDDLSAGEPSCSTTDDCRIKVIGEPGLTVNCTNNRCIGYNAKHNLLQCTHTFLESFLEYPPMTIRFNVTNIMEKIRNHTYDARKASEALASLLSSL
ncbi:extracellular tyrosine-protein kinase PKDCC-like [Amphiura filiformis]|uniref:extracellular tyrosine-protein kinase PKDCC-like n=1 Tax=Amphiura filiformis TaxID=82378 RepID=UPI003B20CA44